MLDATLFRFVREKGIALDIQIKRLPRQKVIGNVTTKVGYRFSMYTTGMQFRLYNLSLSDGVYDFKR